ncbi:5-hydroxytryptamine receptor 1B-like [Paramacrobiotus metropolitanus]|uniref:5-hydroxytryptamine receptor 1B-like n=1 Tax=Paramacrobiotus metropolitanus TaxID=2943436 RepID=UPI0024463BB2|nr:5-hydroxytryptamine receptor 1B-like [Paramacrobiotus metropolitanus]
MLNTSSGVFNFSSIWLSSFDVPYPVLPSQSSYTWSNYAISEILISISGIIFNAFIILTFAYHRYLLKNVFMIYLLNISVAHVTFAVLNGSVDLAVNGYSEWRFSRAVCTFDLYTHYVLESLIVYGHLLITLSRFWESFFPDSYNRYHARKTVVCLCIIQWIFVHLVYTPGIILNSYKTVGINSACRINLEIASVNVWMEMMVVLFILVEIVIIAFCPFILLRERTLQAKVSVEADDVNTVEENISEAKSPNRNGFPLVLEDIEHPNIISIQLEADAERLASERRSMRRCFLLFTGTTLLFWTPLVTCLSISTYDVLRRSEAALDTVSMLYSLQIIVDPTVFVISFPNVRSAMWLSVRCFVSL